LSGYSDFSLAVYLRVEYTETVEHEERRDDKLVHLELTHENAQVLKDILTEVLLKLPSKEDNTATPQQQQWLRTREHFLKNLIRHLA